MPRHTAFEKRSFTTTNARIAAQIMSKLVRTGGLTGARGAQRYWAHGKTFSRIANVPATYGGRKPGEGGLPQLGSAADIQKRIAGDNTEQDHGDPGGIKPGPGFSGLREGATKGLSPELVARYNAMWEAAPPEAKKGAGVISGVRSRELQAQLYQKYLRGGNIAAPPGRSRHEKGGALDIRDPTGWFHKHAAEYGLHFPVLKRTGRDYPHTELDPSYKGPSYAARAKEREKAEKAEQDRVAKDVSIKKDEEVKSARTRQGKKTAKIDVDFSEKKGAPEKSNAGLKQISLEQPPQMNASTRSNDQYAEGAGSCISAVGGCMGRGHRCPWPRAAATSAATDVCV
jgi:D-alanyl-D-alanine carboxypeptidase